MPNPDGTPTWLEILAELGEKGDPAAEEARVALAEKAGIVDPAVAARLREQIATSPEGVGNINLGVEDVAPGGVSEGQVAEFEWNEQGTQIQMIPKDTADPICGVGQRLVNGKCVDIVCGPNQELVNGVCVDIDDDDDDDDDDDEEKEKGFEPWAPFDPNAGDPGWFGGDDGDPVNEKGVPKFTEADLRKARLLLESELRMAGFDANAIGRLIESWVIPRLTGTYVGVDGVLMLPPDDAADLLPELYTQPEFYARFPGYHARIDAGYNAIDIQDYLKYENRFKELMMQYGLDTMLHEEGGVAAEYISNLISSNISLTQVDKRITQGIGAVLNAPEEVLAQYEEWYGAEGENALLATFLDPNQDLVNLGKMAQTAAAGGYAQKVLGKGIGQDMAEQIADLDYSNQQLYEAYSKLTQQAALFQEKLGEEDWDIEDEGVSFALNLDQDAITRIQRRREARAADFRGGGGALVSGATTGFGAANA